MRESPPRKLPSDSVSAAALRVKLVAARPRVGQPGWACGHTRQPCTPPWRQLTLLVKGLDESCNCLPGLIAHFSQPLPPTRTHLSVVALGSEDMQTRQLQRLLLLEQRAMLRGARRVARAQHRESKPGPMRIGRIRVRPANRRESTAAAIIPSYCRCCSPARPLLLFCAQGGRGGAALLNSTHNVRTGYTRTPSMHALG